MRQDLARLALAFALAVPFALAGCTGADGFDAVHADSRPNDLGFVEVFRVTRAPDGWTPGELAFRLDGAEIEVEWTDPDGVVSVEDEFAFVAEAFDTMRHLEVWRSDERVWEKDYAGGAGAPLG